MLFPTGFAANLGTIAALVGPGDAVYSDRLNHACLIDGARLSGATAPGLSAQRRRPARSDPRRATGAGSAAALIATDGVFSMDGDLAPLADLADLAERFGAMLLVDEAHGTGVFGPDGRGAASACGVADRVHVRVGTLSKALGSLGGFVAGSRRLIDWLINHARPLDLLDRPAPPPPPPPRARRWRSRRPSPGGGTRVRALGRRAAPRRLTAAGFEVGPSAGPIVPVLARRPRARPSTLAERAPRRGLPRPRDPAADRPRRDRRGSGSASPPRTPTTTSPRWSRRHAADVRSAMARGTRRWDGSRAGT